MPNSTTQIATTAAPTAIAKSSRSTWYQVPANGRSTRLKSTCWPPSRRRRGPGRLLQQPLPVPKGRLCGGLYLCLEHPLPHLPGHRNAGSPLLIALHPLRIRRLTAGPEHRTQPQCSHSRAGTPRTTTQAAQPGPCGTDADGLRPAPPDSGCPPDGAGPLLTRQGPAKILPRSGCAGKLLGLAPLSGGPLRPLRAALRRRGEPTAL